MALDRTKAVLGASLLLSWCGTATAQAPADQKFTLKPLLESRLRFEDVDQPSLDGEALTLRIRAGAEAMVGKVAFLAEAEGTVALVNNYNAFPFPLPGEQQWKPEQSVIADPQNVELNRLQVQYRARHGSLTLGRQRINLDDQRWVGSVGWRQNEQTFDAIRGELKSGATTLDLSYAIKQRTIFGSDAGPRTAYDGQFMFVGAGSKVGPVQGKLFAYLLDYDETFFVGNSSQTYGLIVSSSVPVKTNAKISLRASYARQSDYGKNPFDYSADYLTLDAGVALKGFSISGGWEKLGSDNGRAVQTPMATLHKFNGWADQFLTTPPNGLQDSYISLSHKFEKVAAISPLVASISYHRFDSDVGNTKYGTEWNASLGFNVGRVALLAKWADYEARNFGVDTRKLWLQAEWALK